MVELNFVKEMSVLSTTVLRSFDGAVVSLSRWCSFQFRFSSSGRERGARGAWATCLERAGVLAAGGAAAAEVNVVILDLKFPRIDLRPREAVQARVFHIHNAPALQANEMMMLDKLGVEAGYRARVAGPSHQTERNEGAQDAMDRHAGDLGLLMADLAVELLRRRVVAAVQDRGKNGAALGRDREAAFAMGGKKAFHPLFFVVPIHGSEVNIWTKR
jgi:hypothetical protein